MGTGDLLSLGTDGFGLSEARPEIRDWFEVSAQWIEASALSLLARRGQLDVQIAQNAMEALRST